MTTPVWQGRVARTSILSATLLSLCPAAEVRSPVAFQETSSPDLSNTTLNALSMWEDQPTPFPIESFVSSFYSDPDLPGVPTGVAIIGADTSHGHWEYAADFQSGTWIPFGSVSASHALLLDFVMFSYSGSGVRFIPDPDWNGTIPSALTLRAWDEGDGIAPSGATPSYGDTTATHAGVNPFGATIASTDLTVNAVQDAPRLDISGSPYVDPATFGVTGAGTRIDTLLSRGAHGSPITEVDGDPIGIAIVGADTTYGSWEYSLDGGSSWVAFPAVSVSSALLLNVGTNQYNSATDVRVHFVAGPTFTGTVTNALSFRAWDLTDWNSAGGLADTTTSGGSAPYSAAVETASIYVTGSTSVVAPVVFPEPPISTAGETRYGAICPGTPEGLTSLLDAMAGKLPSDARAFSWDGVTQRFVELPSQPTAGLHPDTGFFLATRAPLPIDFAGSLSAIPYVLTLQPGWNLVGVPALDDAGTTTLSHPWDDFELIDDTATQVTDPVVFTDVLGTPSSGVIATARPWFWDGSGYQQVTTLDTGKAYWIKNNSSVVYTLLRTASSQSPQPRLAQAATALAVPRGTITDRGTPPRPPTAAAAAPSNGCGVGSGIGVLVLSMAGLLRGRRRS
jgi:hypothetical protein